MNDITSNDEDNFVRNFEKRFLEKEKMASRKIPGTSSARIFFMLILLISNHTVFLVQFGMNFALVSFFEKAEIVFA